MKLPQGFMILFIEEKKLGRIVLEVEAILDQGLVRAVATVNVFDTAPGDESHKYR